MRSGWLVAASVGVPTSSLLPKSPNYWRIWAFVSSFFILPPLRSRDWLPPRSQLGAHNHLVEGGAKEPIHPDTAREMGLSAMSESEMAALGTRRVMQDATDLHMPEVPENLRHLELQPAR